MIYIDRSLKTPVYEQLYNAMRDDIIHHKQKGDRIPPIRTTASQLGVSVNTVNRAYQQLLIEGYISSLAGSGYYCNEISRHMFSGEIQYTPSPPPYNNVKYNFSYGSVDNREFPWGNWRKCLKEAMLREELTPTLSYQDKQGHWGLRETLVSYLKTSRNVVCRPEQIVITSSLQSSIDLLTAVLPPMEYHLGMEEPGYDGARNAFWRNHYPISPIPVDEGGLSVEHLRRSKCNLVYVTPSHQFPTGVVMPVTRRQELLQAIHERDGYIVEDDYDSEFRYGTLSIPSMQSMSNNDRVIYIGTLSKSLSPTIRLTYLVLPNRLLPEYHYKFQNGKTTVPNLIQYAAEEFIKRGYFSKHLRKTISFYEIRSRAVAAAFAQEDCPYITPQFSRSGLHILLKIKTPFSQEETLRLIEKKGVQIYPTSKYWMSQEDADPATFLMGFNCYCPEEIAQGIHRLCQAVTELNE